MLHRSNGQESGCQITPEDFMRIGRILKNSTKLRYLERRNNDADLAQSLDPDHYPTKCMCTMDERGTFDLWKDGATITAITRRRTAPYYLAHKTSQRERPPRGLARCRRPAHSGGSAYVCSSQEAAAERICHGAGDTTLGRFGGIHQS
jgi:hypothetical protein